jgi:hypothetical protein
VARRWTPSRTRPPPMQVTAHCIARALHTHCTRIAHALHTHCIALHTPFPRPCGAPLARAFAWRSGDALLTFACGHVPFCGPTVGEAGDET